MLTAFFMPCPPGATCSRNEVSANTFMYSSCIIGNYHLNKDVRSCFQYNHISCVYKYFKWYLFCLSNEVQILIGLITWRCSLRQLQNVIFLICLIFFVFSLFAFEEMTVPSGHLWRNSAILRELTNPILP